jgi:ABC-type transport system involved in multi-copper enzyme maturation permease subunit
MKYLAILKDSLREALDSKVLYVLAGISGVLTLLLLSVSFRPVSAEEALRGATGQFLLVYADRGRSVVPQTFLVLYAVEDLQRLDDGTEPYTGEYRFTLKVTPLPGSEEEFPRAVAFWSQPLDLQGLAKLHRADPGRLPDRLMEAFVKGQLELFSNFQVESVQRAPAPAQGAAAVGLLGAPLGQGPLVAAAANAPGKALAAPKFTVRVRGPGSPRTWPHEPCLFFGAMPLPFLRSSLGRSVYWVEDGLVNGWGAWVAILIGVVITAFFIPNLLRKGSVDLLLAKPIHRSSLLLYKYLGGLTFILLASAVTVFGVWLALGVRTGIWAPGFLLTVFILTFFFAILYAVSTLFGVLTRSTVVAILMTCGVWFLLWLVGTIHTSLESLRGEPALAEAIPAWGFSTAKGAHAVLPRTTDLDLLTTRLLADPLLTRSEARRLKLERQPEVSWAESLGVSVAFIAVMLGLACWRFVRKDY